MTPEFRAYQEQVIKNSKFVAAELIKRDFKIVTGKLSELIILCVSLYQGMLRSVRNLPYEG